MTFRQIIEVLYFRKWLVLSVVGASLVGAILFLSVQPASYESSTTVRTSASVTEAAASGQLGGVQVDFDSSKVTSSEILQAAAALAGEPGVDYALLITTDVSSGGQTDSITITATADSPELAQRRATAVADAYREYLQQHITTTLATLADRQKAATTKALAYQALYDANNDDSIAKANLQSSLSTLSGLNDEIETLNNAGVPLTTLTPAAPGSSVNTSPLIVLLLALVCGLIAGIGVALIRDQFDDRLRGGSELEQLTGAPTLAELPFDPSLAKLGVTLPTAGREQTALSEGLRSLRTSLQVLLPARAVVVVTSVEPDDGKSFVAANLAVTWAKVGKRVILVGGDLRRPTLATYFGDAADGPGLAELLLDAARQRSTPRAAQVTALLNETDFTGLRVLPAGIESADPADLLATSALAETVLVLRQLVDVVIIDSPPAMALVDASLLAEQSDGAVVLATIRRTERNLLVQTVDSLRHNGVVVLGAVANRSRRTTPKSYNPYYARNTSSARQSDDETAITSDQTVEVAMASSSQLADDQPPRTA